MALTEWAQRIIVRTENDRKQNGIPYEDFGWLHLPCESAVKERRVGDGVQKYCNLHKVSSAVAPAEISQ